MLLYLCIKNRCINFITDIPDESTEQLTPNVGHPCSIPAGWVSSCLSFDTMERFVIFLTGVHQPNGNLILVRDKLLRQSRLPKYKSIGFGAEEQAYKHFGIVFALTSWRFSLFFSSKLGLSTPSTNICSSGAEPAVLCIDSGSLRFTPNSSDSMHRLKASKPMPTSKSAMTQPTKHGEACFSWPWERESLQSTSNDDVATQGRQPGNVPVYRRHFRQRRKNFLQKQILCGYANRLLW